MEADKAESKTKLLKTLAKEVNGIKKDVDEQKVKTDNIAEWVKNTFRPGMEKMKGIYYNNFLSLFTQSNWYLAGCVKFVFF